ncbi:MAG: isoprenylcysteine carboxylmethyltransferase family protein, partial [Chloroflexota bacterium]
NGDSKMTGYIFISISAIIWGVLHSITASNWFKHIVKLGVGPAAFHRFYRFAYNLFSAASIFPILLMLLSFPDNKLYTISAPWVYLTSIIQGLCFFVLIAGVMQTGAMEFIGLSQLSDLYHDEPSKELVINGMYAYVRHPLYSAGLVILWLKSDMTVNSLVLWIIFTLYIFIGAYFEEKKLLIEYGQSYNEYMAKVPMFIPKFPGK